MIKHKNILLIICPVISFVFSCKCGNSSSLDFNREISNSQDTCLLFSEGFIIKITSDANKNNNESSMVSVDYFYFADKPNLNIDSNLSPIALYNKGGVILNYKYLIDRNLFSIINNNYQEFDFDVKSRVDHINTDNFKIELFKVQMAYFFRFEKVEEFALKRISSHTFRYLKYLPEDELNDTVRIIYPKLIKSL